MKGDLLSWIGLVKVLYNIFRPPLLNLNGPISKTFRVLYIPLQRESPTRDIGVANTNMLVSKNPCGPNASPQRELIMPNTNL